MAAHANDELTPSFEVLITRNGVLTTPSLPTFLKSVVACIREKAGQVENLIPCRALYSCVEYYSGTRYYGSDMQRESDEPGFVARLPTRHPVRTMSSEKPGIADGEYELSKQAYRVMSLRMTDHGDECHLVCVYADGSSRMEMLTGYIVMNLCGYLKACLDLHGFMTTTPRGSA